MEAGQTTISAGLGPDEQRHGERESASEPSFASPTPSARSLSAAATSRLDDEDPPGACASPEVDSDYTMPGVAQEGGRQTFGETRERLCSPLLDQDVATIPSSSLARATRSALQKQAATEPLPELTASGLDARASVMFDASRPEAVASTMRRAVVAPTGKLMLLVWQVSEDWPESRIDELSRSFGNFDKVVGRGWLAGDALGVKPLLDKSFALKLGFAVKYHAEKIEKAQAKATKRVGRLAAGSVKRADAEREEAAKHAERLAAVIDLPDITPLAQTAARLVSRKRQREAPAAVPAPAPRTWFTEDREREDAMLAGAVEAARSQIHESTGYLASAAAYQAAAQAYHDAPPTSWLDAARLQRGDALSSARDAWGIARDAISQPLKAALEVAEKEFEAAATDVARSEDGPLVERLLERLDAAMLAFKAAGIVLREPHERAEPLVRQKLEREAAWRETETAREAELNAVPPLDEYDSGTEMDLEHAYAWLQTARPWLHIKELRVRRHGRIHGVTDGRLHLYYRERGEASFTRMEMDSHETVPGLALAG